MVLDRVGTKQPSQRRVVIPVITNLWTCRGSSFIFKQKWYDERRVYAEAFARVARPRGRGDRGGGLERDEKGAKEGGRTVSNVSIVRFYQWIPGYIVSPHEWCCIVRRASGEVADWKCTRSPFPVETLPDKSEGAVRRKIRTRGNVLEGLDKLCFVEMLAVMNFASLGARLSERGS